MWGSVWGCVCVCLVVSDSFVTPWTVAPQAPLFGEFCRQDSGVGCHFLLQGIFLIQGSNLHLPCLLHWQADSLLLSHLVSPLCYDQPPFHGQCFKLDYVLHISVYISCLFQVFSNVYPIISYSGFIYLNPLVSGSHFLIYST